MKLTQEQTNAIANYVNNHYLPVGVGTKESACSIAAINLALTGELTDRIPECMSRVIGRWIIRVQDKMPNAMRNSEEWKSLLPLAAGTGRELEKDRITIIMNWIWTVSLPLLQPIADKRGFGEKWKEMLDGKTQQLASDAAAAAAYAAAYAADAYAATYAAAAAAAYAAAAAAAAYAYAYAADAAADAYAADAAAYAYADAAAAAAARNGYWQTVNPCKLLKELIEVGNV
jgi:hypothetical protein